MIFEDIDKYKNKNGIYMILNTVTNYKYIGCTKSGFLNRFKRHYDIIAEKYNVKKSCISNIRYNYRWKHVIVDGWDDYQKKPTS